MMNLGVDSAGAGLPRSDAGDHEKHGIVLIFDEVKTGLCVAAGGATEKFGVHAGHGDDGQGARRRTAVRRRSAAPKR